MPLLQKLQKELRTRWYQEAGYHQVLVIALPMILSTGSWSLQIFIDRMFLSWYSTEALAASVPAGLLSYSLICLFIGIATILNTFVAQYFGSKQKNKIGRIVWQGVYLALFSILFIMPFYIFSEDIFSLFEHGKELERLEAIYFKLILLATPFMVLVNSISSFYSGIANTKIVMWINLFMVLINIILDYLLVFGIGFFPKLGIEGAAIATVLSSFVGAALFLFLFLGKKNDSIYYTRKSWLFNKADFFKLLKFGIPNGLQMFIEVSAFAALLIYVGRIGMIELSATNIAFNINTLTFLPMVGMMIAIASLVGQKLGENKPELAERAVWSGLQIAAFLFSLIGLSFLLIPEFFIAPFGLKADPTEFQSIAEMATIMLMFIAAYSLMDAGVYVFGGGLKGAGDTTFVAITTAIFAWGAMVIPSALIVELVEHPIYWLWALVTLYATALNLVFYVRFKRGTWKTMRVIETE